MVGGGHDRPHPPGGARREPAYTPALARTSAERSEHVQIVEQVLQPEREFEMNSSVGWASAGTDK